MQKIHPSWTLVLPFLASCAGESHPPESAAPSEAVQKQGAANDAKGEPHLDSAPLAVLPSGALNICPKDASEQKLNLSSAVLKRVPEIKNHFESFGNIEGPVWIKDALYFSNISGGENPPEAVIWKWIPGTSPVIVAPDSGSNGLAVDAEGRLVSAMHSDGTVSVRPLDSVSEATPVIRHFSENRFNSPNDLVISSRGQLYFTDPTWQAPKPNPQPTARAYRVSGGRAEQIGVEGQPQNPNGITLSLDEATLFIGGVNGLYRYSVNSDGSVGSTGALVETSHLSSSSGIDGLGRDCAGHIYITVHSENLVVVLSKEGDEVGALEVPGATGVTNVAFGGLGRKTLFVTSLGAEPKLHQATLNVTGFPY